jgi:hypothetical protein
MEEIVRIRELMGYKIGVPINEQRRVLIEAFNYSYFKPENWSNLIKLIDDDLSSPTRILDNAYNPLVQELEKIYPGKSVDEQLKLLKNDIENTAGFQKLDADQRKAFDELLKKSWDDMFKKIDTLSFFDRMGYWGLVSDEFNAIRNLRDEIRRAYNLDELTTEEIRSFKEMYEGVSKGLNEYIQNSTNIYGKLPDDLKDLLKEIDDYLKIKPLSGGFFSFIPTLPTEVYDALYKWFGAFYYGKKEGIKKLQDEIQKINNKIKDELTREGGLAQNAVPDQVIDDITRKIWLLKKEAEQNMLETLEGLTKTMGSDGKPILDTQVYEKIKSDQGNLFNRWYETEREIFNNSELRAKYKTKGVMGSAMELNAFKELLLWNPLTAGFDVWSKTPKGEKYKYSEKVAQWAKRTVAFTIWNNPALPSELINLRNYRGIDKWAMVGGKVVTGVVGKAVLVPMFTAIAETLFEMIGDVLELGLGDDFWTNLEYGVGDFGEEWDLWKQYWTNVKEALPNEIPGFTKEDVDKSFLDYALFFTKIDELVDFLGNIKSISSNDKKIAQEKLKELLGKIEKWKDDLAQLSDKKFEDALAEWEEIKKNAENDYLENCVNKGDITSEYCKSLKQLIDDINNKKPKKEGGDANQNGGGGVTPPVDPNPAPVISGLEQEMKTAFEEWQQEGHPNSQWNSFSNNVGYVTVEGKKVIIQRLSNGVIALMLDQPVKLN